MAKKLISFDDEKSNLGLPDAVEERLDDAYASKDLEAQVAPQKMVFELPVHKPHRNPNMSITKVWPDATGDIQVVFTEGDTAWGIGRDRSLYKSTSAGHWEHKAYRSNSIAARGGMVRCADGSLLHFDMSYKIFRSTDEGKTWTNVHDRRAPGLEPLSTQSTMVHPKTGHVYYGEYVTNVSEDIKDCALWRSTDNGVTWEVFYTWPLLNRSDSPDVIRHIHALQVDPYTDEVYVMAGDGTDKTGIWKVQGETCVPVLTNDMLGRDWLDAPRCISLMFFPDYVAWGSDSTTNPYIFRIPRSAFGTDPSKLERGTRLSSTAWGAALVSEDGSRWALFTSDEAYPAFAADRMAHIYAVEDQGATVYEVGSIPSRTTSGVTTLQPMAQPEKYGLEFAFNMRTGASSNYAAWRARIGYGGQAIPWPAQPKRILTQSQSSGVLELEGGQSKVFGGTRVPVYAKTLAIYDSSITQQGGVAGALTLQVVVDGAVVWSSTQASSRSQGRREFGGPVALIPLVANTNVTFQAFNVHPSNPLSGATSITYEWVG